MPESSVSRMAYLDDGFPDIFWDSSTWLHLGLQPIRKKRPRSPQDGTKGATGWVTAIMIMNCDEK
jgi:hypothetical protein